MKSFAPMPISALTGKIVPVSAFRLLGHLLGLRTLFEFRDEFSVTDYELLKGYRDRKSGTQFPWCGLSRNTFTVARAKLVELGYIKIKAERSNTGQSRYLYSLVPGMAILYREEQAHILTTAPSTNDSLYIEENIEINPSPPYPTETLRPINPESHPEQLIPDVLTIDEMVNTISRYYTHYHPHKLPMPNPGAVRAALKSFRKTNPGWSLYRMSICIDNIYRSDSYVNKARSPDIWIKRLPDFSVGPLDEFGHVLEVSPRFNHAQENQAPDAS
jgi:hypothetical protein